LGIPGLFKRFTNTGFRLLDEIFNDDVNGFSGGQPITGRQTIYNKNYQHMPTNAEVEEGREKDEIFQGQKLQGHTEHIVHLKNMNNHDCQYCERVLALKLKK
jgi:hypothetical protein